MKIVMSISGADLPAEVVDDVGRQLVEVVRQYARRAVPERTGTRAHVHVEAWTVHQPRTQEAQPCPEPTSSPRPDPSPARSGRTPATSSASPPPSPGAPSAPTPGTTPPTTGAPTSGGPTPAEAASSTPSVAATGEPSLASDAAAGGLVHLDEAPVATSPPSSPWDDTSGKPDPATVARLVRDGGPGFATGADLRAAALELDDDTASYGDISQYLGLPLGVVRSWLREDARA